MAVPRSGALAGPGDAPAPGGTAATWDLAQRFPPADAEDGVAVGKAANAFFKRPLDYVRGGEVPVHCFIAGFNRGRAWALHRGLDRLRDAQAFRAAAGVAETLRGSTPAEIAQTLRGMADLLLNPPK
jgi:hypothetical protein